MRKHRIHQQTVLIVGASQGLGRQLAIQLAEKNNTLILMARNLQKLEQLKQECTAHNVNAHALQCDIGDEDQLNSTLDTIAERFGVPDMIIANAAICHLAEEIDMTSFSQHVNVNLLGHLQVFAHFLPKMRERRSGRLVAINSITALTPMPIYLAYTTSKAGLRMFMQSLRMHLRGTGILCQSVYPGFIDTPMLEGRSHPRPLQKTAGEMARLVITRLESGHSEIFIPRLFGLAARMAQRLPTTIYHLLFSRYLLGRFYDEDRYHRG